MYYYGMFQISTLGVTLLVLYLMSFIIPIGVGIYLVINFLSAPKRYMKPEYFKDPKTFFAVIIPARNEEKIIAHTIQQLKTIKYPTNLYKIIVIADNCTDNTAMIARNEDVKVYVRKDINKRSKASALKWLFAHGDFIDENFDSICILDADAILADDFLNIMDMEICNGYDIVQGRLGSANPYDSLTSGFMTVLASVENRLWYLPQATRGRSGFYIGTGVCITLERIQKTGWDISTLVEDAEFSIQTVLKGGFVRYCDNAHYYVEQVTTWRQLWKQQRRWRSGQIACLKKYLKPLFSKVFKDRNKNAISLLILILIPVLCVSFLFQTIATPILFGEFFGYDKFQPVFIAIGFIVNGVVMFLAFSFILWLDGIFSFKLWKGIIAVIFSPFFYGLVDLASIFQPIKEWNPIMHGQSKGVLSKDKILQLGLIKNSKHHKKQDMRIQNPETIIETKLSGE